MAELTARQARFVDLYMVSLNATQAYRDAYGVGQKAAEASGARLLGNVKVAKAIADAKSALARKVGIDAETVINRLWTIATADPRELIEYRRTCCRYCHGLNFDYQRTRNEMARDRSSWEAAQKKASKEEFNESGGIGYNATRDPHADCPECFGEGVERAFVHDTRKLSASALCLYAGVKVTKDGIEVKMHNQQDALLSVGRHLGLFEEKTENPLSEEERIARMRAAIGTMDLLTTGPAT